MENARRKHEERAILDLYLKLKGFVVHRMPRDPCCLYHSIAAAVANVYGDYLNTLSSEEMEDRQQTVRGKVYEQLIKNTSKYKDFFPVVGADQMSPDDLDEARKLEMKKVLDKGHWGGEGDIMACSVIYNKRFIVEGALGVRFDTAPGEDTEISNCVFLVDENEKQYNLLQKQPNPKENLNTHKDVVPWFFKEKLRLLNLEYVYQNFTGDSLLDVLSFAFVEKNQNTHLFQKNLEYWVDKGKPPYIVGKYYSKMKSRHPQDFRIARHQEELQHKDILAFVKKLLQNPSLDENLLIELAGDDYEKNVVIHRPLDEDTTIQYNEEELCKTVHLAQDLNGWYSVVQKTTLEIEIEDDITFIGPMEENANIDTTELVYIQGHVLRNISSEISVIFLVPGKLQEETLEKAIATSPKSITHIVVYNPEDLKRLKGDKELRQWVTMYQYKFSMPLNMDSTQRFKRLASFLLPPLFWMVNNKTTGNNIPYNIMVKYSPNSLPVILLTHMWDRIKKNVMADVVKLVKPNTTLLCERCSPTCELREIQSHYDASRFTKLELDEDQYVLSLERFTMFNDDEEKLAPAMEKIKNLLEVPDPENNWSYLRDHLDKNKKDAEWSTYFVVHLDGDHMDKYDKEKDNYYDMMGDPCVIKSVYVGKTTNEEFRMSHFVTSTALSQIFSKTSRLFLIRSRKFTSPDLAQADEAMLIEIITTWLKSMSKRKKKTDILFLNVRAEYMPLLEFATKDDIKMWAEFAASDIHILMFSESNTTNFDKYDKFKGNFPKDKELRFLGGNFENRTFQSLQQVYALIRARQP